MTWIHESREITEIPEQYVGFVYLITNQITGKKYIGKKLSKFAKTSYRIERLRNGKKRRRRIRTKVDSDWKTYYGSCAELNKDIELLGQEKFLREILHFCRNKAECSYLEAREQLAQRVLESEDYYNSLIHLRVHKSHIMKLCNIGTG